MQLGSTASYAVSDIRDPTTKYFFNVCGAVAPPQTQPASPNQCTTGGRTYNQWPAAAWQLDQSVPPDDCHRLGSTNATMGWNFTLMDSAYPDRGVVITYQGGENVWCPFGVSRSFSVALSCALTTPSVSAYSAATVVEYDTCSYSVVLPSIAGCPLQCRDPSVTTNAKLCSGNGVCGFNQDVGASQCYCYDGFSGNLCQSSTSASSGLGVEGIMLIIVCIILVGVLGLVAFMLLKLRKIHVNPAAYAELQGKCEFQRSSNSCRCRRLLLCSVVAVR